VKRRSDVLRAQIKRVKPEFGVAQRWWQQNC
jgi:hypothetical protein